MTRCSLARSMTSCWPQIEYAELMLMAADGGFTACRIRRRPPSTDILALHSMFRQPLRGPSVWLCVPSIHHFPLYSLSIFQTAPPPSPSLISPFSQDVGRSASTFPSASFASWLCTAAQVFSGSQVANWFPSVGR